MSDKNNNQTASSTNKKQAVQTTGHAWDGDIQEYNNPLPRWWLWTFYATIVFTIVYWLLYPSFPVGNTYLKGLKTLTFTENGKQYTNNWNTRSLFYLEMQNSKSAINLKNAYASLENVSLKEISQDPEKMNIARSMAKVIFADNCAACHGSGASGIVGMYPNLVDDDWLWGGTLEDIHITLADGRVGYMPAFSRSLDNGQLENVAQYVLSLSGINGGEADKISTGKAIFQGMDGGCYYCHTTEGTGLKSQGAANLTDAVWTIVDVPAANSYSKKLSLVEGVISKGVNKEMPAWKERLSPTQINLMTAYIHQLGGGQ